MNIEPGNQWPSEKDKARITGYEHYDQLYSGEHFKAFAIKGDKDFTERYSRLRYITANFAGIISRVFGDMLFGEGIVIDCKDKTNQGFVDGFLEKNHFLNQCYESSLGNSRRGDSLFKLRIGPLNPGDKTSTVIAEEISPATYYPQLDISSGRYKTTADVLVWQFEDPNDPKKTLLHKETHTSGQITHEIFSYDPSSQKIIARLNAGDYGFDDIEYTKVDRPLIFHVPNVRDGSGFWGTSDYRDLETLFFALNNRITKVDNILDKHSDPILAVPPGVLDEKGQVKKEALGMFEVDNENAGFNKPEYIVWNANLESAFSQIDKLVEMLFMFSEVSPGTMGLDKNGQAESGRALKMKLIRTIAKRNRKKNYYDIVIKEMLETAQKLGKAWNIDIDGFKVTTPEKPEIKWGDGIVQDYTEQIDAEVKRVEAGLSSRADSISKLDGLKPEDAKNKVAEIDKEDSITVPSLDKVNNETKTPPTPPPNPQQQPNNQQPINAKG